MRTMELNLKKFGWKKIKTRIWINWSINQSIIIYLAANSTEWWIYDSFKIFFPLTWKTQNYSYKKRRYFTKLHFRKRSQQKLYMKYWEYHGINLTTFHKKKNDVDWNYTVEISKINIGQRDFVKVTIRTCKQ